MLDARDRPWFPHQFPGGNLEQPAERASWKTRSAALSTRRPGCLVEEVASFQRLRSSQLPTAAMLAATESSADPIVLVRGRSKAKWQSLFLPPLPTKLPEPGGYRWGMGVWAAHLSGQRRRPEGSAIDWARAERWKLSEAAVNFAPEAPGE